MSARPRVSVIVPAFNEPAHILRASFASLREQSLADFECLVVDESTDPERAGACEDCCTEDRRFTYIRPALRIGLPASLNLALRQAQGELIARFDSDDLCNPDRLRHQVAFLDANAGVSVLGGALEVIDEEGRTIAFRRYPLGHLAIAHGMQFTSTIAHPTVMFRRSAALSHGAYDASFRYSEDLDLWLRWLNAGLRFANLPDVLVRYRQKSVVRNRLHWRCNLRARVRNFAVHDPLRRAAGIVGIGAWMLVPSGLQEIAFRALLFRRSAKRVET